MTAPNIAAADAFMGIFDMKRVEPNWERWQPRMRELFPVPMVKRIHLRCLGEDWFICQGCKQFVPRSDLLSGRTKCTRQKCSSP